MIQAATICPLRVFSPFKMVNEGWVSFFRLARPDPDEAIALFDGEAFDTRKTLNSLIGHRNCLAVATHHKPVITTYKLAVFD
ncbi:hypothetical protein D3C76_1644010 [compost metagenome]